MVYRFLRIVATWATKIYFHKIYVTGLENVPQDRPLFISCNHPSGFMEPVLLSCYLPRILHFLVRGDMFRKAWLKPLLVNTNQIPIFRVKDGFSNLRNNVKTIQSTTEVLNKDQAILIFTEGSTQMVKRLRPLQKGMGRMIFSAIDEYPDLSPAVLPVGINFVSPMKFGREVYINIGPPIEVDEYKEAYHENKVATIHQLTKDTFSAMHPLVLNVTDERMDTFDKLCEISKAYSNENYWPIVEENSSFYENDRKLAQYINDLNDADYSDLAKEVENQKNNKVPFYKLIIPFLLGFPGYLFHLIPATMVTGFARSKVKSDVFFSSIRMSVGILYFLVYYLCLLLIFVFLPLSPWYVFLGIPLGILFLYYNHFKIQQTRKSLQNSYDHLKNKFNNTQIPLS